MALTAGSRIGPYEIQSALGAGGMGEVYRARDTRLDRMVAIKVLSPNITTDPAFLERFDREARTISQLNHRQSGQRRLMLYAASLGSPQGQRVTGVDSNVALAPPGYLLFVRQRTLVAQPFDSERMQTRGDPQPIASDVGFTGYGARGAFSVSATGVLVYRTDPPRDCELVWVDRSGRRLSVLGPPGRYSEPALSPDDTTVAYSLEDEPTRTSDIWLVNPARPAPSKLTKGSGRNRAPVWSPEGAHIVFQSIRQTDSGLYVKAVDTAKEQLLLRVGNMRPRDWSTNGFILAERRQRSAGIFKVPSSGDAGPTQFLDDDLLGDYTPTFSPPDGRWVAYASDDTGRQEVYTRRFDGSGRPVPISGGTGSEPRWRADGKELFYLTDAPDTSMMAVDIIGTGETLEAGPPRRLFPVSVVTSTNTTRYAVKSDGQRFLGVQPVGGPVGGNDPLPLTVVLSWTSRLKR